MKKLVLAAAFVVAFSAHAEEPVYELVDLMGGQDQMVQMHNQFISMLASSSPEMAAHEPVLRKWAETYLSWDQMRDGMADIYRKHFNETEIKGLLDFYQSPVGQKSVELMPVLFQEGGQLGMSVAQAHQGDLERMIEEAEAKKASAAE